MRLLHDSVCSETHQGLRFDMVSILAAFVRLGREITQSSSRKAPEEGKRVQMPIYLVVRCLSAGPLLLSRD